MALGKEVKARLVVVADVVVARPIVTPFTNVDDAAVQMLEPDQRLLSPRSVDDAAVRVLLHPNFPAPS